MTDLAIKNDVDNKLDSKEILQDYLLAVTSRHISVIGRREVVSGRAKFGIFGDGKELAQIAMAKVFRKGDFRSGYYRDQTLMFAIGAHTYQEYFAQLYAHADVREEPATGGRAMNAHFATRSLDDKGEWKILSSMANSSVDVSPTGSQMPRLVGLAYASRLYRELKELHHLTQFSKYGNEIAFGTVGNATCAEGMFWESLNAIGVLKCPALITIYDDGFGISVSNELAITKQNISELLTGFKRSPGSKVGFDLYDVHGWNYPGLVETYRIAESVVRKDHVPAIIHVTEMTQPQGHSTSGSQERYKSNKRLEWEKEHDCITRFRHWIISEDISSPDELNEIENNARRVAEDARKKAWEVYFTSMDNERQNVINVFDQMIETSAQHEPLKKIKEKYLTSTVPLHRHNISAIEEALITTRNENLLSHDELIAIKKRIIFEQTNRYSLHLHSEESDSALLIPEILPEYSDQSKIVNGFEVLNACFDAALTRDARVIAFGEDVGKLGDVNQGFRGLQEKYGELRVTDTGIRELTIIGQAIGLAMRGLRPIAEIQYIDYLLYALQIISDDLATVRWRSCGGQKAPVIIRTRGHRLEGIWHSGSPMAGIINLVRGVYVLVPRNMVQAAGFYNTLLLAEEPGIVVEVLNGYRQHEKLPDNIGEFTIPLGVPEVIQEGNDITLVTYGANCRIVKDAADMLVQTSINAEIIDVRSLLPFDIHGKILESLKKTGRVVFIDEDVPGGASAYMMQEVMENQGGYYWLDYPPRTITAKTHRPAYGSDGDYWSKPNAELIFEEVYRIMHESDPTNFPLFF